MKIRFTDKFIEKYNHVLKYIDNDSKEQMVFEKAKEYSPHMDMIMLNDKIAEYGEEGNDYYLYAYLIDRKGKAELKNIEFIAFSISALHAPHKINVTQFTSFITEAMSQELVNA